MLFQHTGLDIIAGRGKRSCVASKSDLLLLIQEDIKCSGTELFYKNQWRIKGKKHSFYCYWLFFSFFLQVRKQAQYQRKINVIWNYKNKKKKLSNQTLGIKMPLRCDHCLLHFTSQGITGWERNVTNMKNINALDQKTDSTEHLLFWCKVQWCYLVNCVLARHEVGGGGLGTVGWRGVRIRSCGIKVGRPSKAQHQPRDQTCLSPSNHPQGHRRTQVRPPARSKSMYSILQTALVNTGSPPRCESDLQASTSIASSVIFFFFYYFRGVKGNNAGNMFICDGPFWHKRSIIYLSICITHNSQGYLHDQSGLMV